MTDVLSSQTIDLPDAAATDRLGAWLAARVGAGDTLLLEGPVGAGKSQLARALIRTCLERVGAEDEVPSPSYTLVQSYDAGGLEIWHADLYRLADPSELVELGLEAAFGRALCIVEWPDRLGDLTPLRTLRIVLGFAGDGRRAVLSGTPSAAVKELQGWRADV
ncbi:MAG: tRNA (adenosine(37)-N6)-threonylcarbamoyltransferase complex ATPase subunit type 1 TsaE [Gemmobacter sp.]